MCAGEDYPVWVDDNGVAYCEVLTPCPFYDIQLIDVNNVIAVAVISRRVKLGITINKLAELSGVSFEAVRRVEHGDGHTVKTLQKILDSLHCRLEVHDI